jgi:hypothetical protein
MATKPSIVFAHGLWADGSCFSKLIPTLQAEGHEVIAAQNSLDTLKGDVAAVHRALGRVSSSSALTWPPAADQSTCAGVRVGVGVTEADGTGEGDSPAVEKFEPTGLLLGDGLLVGTGISWG